MTTPFAGKTPFNAKNDISYNEDCIRPTDGMVRIGTKKGDEILVTYEEGLLALQIMPDVGFRGPAKTGSSLLKVHGWK